MTHQRLNKLLSFLRRHIYWLTASVLLVLAIIAYSWWHGRPTPPRYVTVPASRGQIVKAIITTGTVNPVITVQVGSYVSGIIQALYCDYNTVVNAGQLCARIDPRPYQLVVDQNTANLDSAKAQLVKDRASLAYAKTNYDRDLSLLKEGVVSQDAVDIDKSAFEQGKAQVALDEAAIEQHQAALNASLVNLGYTDIISPVDGIVVSRNIDVGQTVAASFQTPTLFLIAKDLTKMQVDTYVSETDIGAAKVGQKASFTVEAYPNKVFWGEVRQVREAPITVQNVVTYDVVVGVENNELELLPGMTANSRIITEERKDVLRVPLQAIRFSPTGLQESGQGGKTGRKAAIGKGPHVWVLRHGKPVGVPVTTGLSDNTNIEITGGDLKVGDPVIVNAITGSAGNQAPRGSRLRF